MNFNWLDVAIFVIILVSIIGAARRGFSREVIGLVAAFLALLLGLWFYGTAGSYFEPYVSSGGVAHFIGFLLVFVSVLIVGALLGWVVNRFLQTVGLSWIDRFLGAAFGGLRGLLLAVALVMILTAFAPGSSAAAPPKAVVESRLAPYVIGASRIVTTLAPHELKDEFYKRYQQVKRAWNEAGPVLPRQSN